MNYSISEDKLNKLIYRTIDNIIDKEAIKSTSNLKFQNEDVLTKITLMDLLNATQDIPVSKVDLEVLKPHLLTWDGDEQEKEKIEFVTEVSNLLEKNIKLLYNFYKKK